MGASLATDSGLLGDVDFPSDKAPTTAIVEKEVVVPNKKFNLTLDRHLWSVWDNSKLFTEYKNMNATVIVRLLAGEQYESSVVEFCRYDDMLRITLKYPDIENSASLDISLGKCDIITSFTDATMWLGFTEGHIVIHFS